MGIFLESFKLPKLTQEEDNLSDLLATEETEFIVKHRFIKKL